MIDREKVIKSLHCRGQDLMIDLPACDGCNYQIQLVNRMGCDYRQICRDALALLKEQEGTINELQNAYGYLQKLFFEAQDELLKEQEAFKPKSKVRHGANAQIQHFCGNCNSMLHGKPKYCSECGKGVLW